MNYAQEIVSNNQSLKSEGIISRFLESRLEKILKKCPDKDSKLSAIYNELEKSKKSYDSKNDFLNAKSLAICAGLMALPAIALSAYGETIGKDYYKEGAALTVFSTIPAAIKVIYESEKQAIILSKIKELCK